ncbi:FHA domain-containing protein [Leptolyngbya sp. NIES-2104]|uniref:FHA domain-containing protein n=1 Tax=Leptolyngbya sp. NIES-2104 TaxID=1552121 RepID=UPI0006EC7EA6|nr:FHA domain-containing protein [Leptolyngbya sp. NIES-2104]GAP99592.1 flavodoxin reductase (ferredoxin-NADPH reductase) family 1 [Leptolyngbya sp. NIES-2104]
MIKLQTVNLNQQEHGQHTLAQNDPDQTEWLIGRAKLCDLVLEEQDISRVHAKIKFSDGIYYFLDAGSLIGSFVNGEKIAQPHRLQVGDRIQLGETFLYVEELMSQSPIAQINANTDAARYWTSEDLTVFCFRIVDETLDTKTFWFTSNPAESTVLFYYQPGQFVLIEVEIEGQPVLRPYSISSTPSRPYAIALTVKRVPSPPNSSDLPPGTVSNWLHDHLSVGDSIKLHGGAQGQFTFLPNLPPKLLLISAGSGITPMMSMSRWLYDTASDADVVFLHSARTPTEIIFCHELALMATQMSNFHLKITVTQQVSGVAWMGLTGRISRSMLELPDLCDRTVFVCGADGFRQSVRTLLEELQFPMEQFHEESFGQRSDASPKEPVSSKPVEDASETNGASETALPKTSKQSDSNGSSPTIHFSQSQQDAIAAPNTTVLEVAQQAGVTTINSSCRAGVCGACKVKVAAGEVNYQHSPSALTDEEQTTGYILACVACPVTRVTVEA